MLHIVSSLLPLLAPPALAADAVGDESAAAGVTSVTSAATDVVADGQTIPEATPPDKGPRPGERPTRRPPGPPPGNPGGNPGHPPGPPPDMSLRPVALVQLWGTLYDMDEDAQGDATGYGDPEDDIGFKVKRARLGLVFEDNGVEAALIAGVAAPYDGLDTKNGDFTLYEAKVGYAKKGLGVSVGEQTVPFSRDALMSSAQLSFTERGLGAEHIAPYHQLGLLGTGEVAGLGVQMGVFNSGGGLFGDDNTGKTLVGRVEYTLGERDVYRFWDPKGKGFGLGVGGGGFLTQDVATQTVAAGGDLMVRVAGLSLMGDFAWAQVNPVNSDVATPGVYDGATRMAITGQLSYGIAEFEPAVRLSTYRDSDLGSWMQIFGGVVYHAKVGGRPDMMRVGLGYEHRDESEAELANDTARAWLQFSLPGKGGRPDMPERGPRR